MRRNRILRGVRFALFGVLFLALFGFVVMSLWNWLMPALFGWKMVTFWQAIGLVILSKIFFGGFRGGPRGWHWRHRMMERWQQMTPQEREKFQAGMRSGFRGFEPPAAKPSA